MTLFALTMCSPVSALRVVPPPEMGYIVVGGAEGLLQDTATTHASRSSVLASPTLHSRPCYSRALQYHFPHRNERLGTVRPSPSPQCVNV
ncbi:hypothetical protein C8Q73DRAFT_500117 [Cubamyces lactineus]|nr:hypothetical protein C8Q73DRAFT_500117 [Cubamyces lactineus]